MPGELTPRGLKTCSDTNTSAAPLLFIPTAHPWGQPAKRSLNFPDPQSGPARHLRAAAAPLRPRSLCGDSPQPPPRAAVRAVRAVRTVTWPLPPAARAAAHPSATSEPARAAAALPPPRRRERAQPCRLRMRSARRGARPAAGGGGSCEGPAAAGRGLWFGVVPLYGDTVPLQTQTSTKNAGTFPHVCVYNVLSAAIRMHVFIDAELCPLNIQSGTRPGCFTCLPARLWVTVPARLQTPPWLQHRTNGFLISKVETRE